MKFTKNYFQNVAKIANTINIKEINNLVIEINKIKKKSGRIFFLGVGGSAGNASHAVNDFRKICNIECYTPVDNVSELTARTNDEGFETIFSSYLINSKLSKNDAIFILSVGGGNIKFNVSLSLIEAIKLAKKKKSKVFSIVGRNDGYAYKHSNISIFTKTDNKKLVTPISEGLQGVIWHCLVSDDRLQVNNTKW